MMEESVQMEPRVAVLITGTYREIEFLLQLLPYMAGPVEYDVFLVLRHVRVDEMSRLGTQEKDFEISRLRPFLNEKYFLCELPSIDPTVATSKYLIPVGPTSEERECGMLSMFYGIFAGISMIKSSMRHYTHVMKTRTDYLPWVAPWVSGMLELYEQSGRKIIVDGVVTKPRRYPDRLDIPWQGSVNDSFCFASVEQFLTLWDIEEILPKVWTGVPETTLFRAAMVRFLGDDLQSHRRNNSLLKKHFIWEPNDTKQSFNMLRSGVLSGEIKQMILRLLKNRDVAVDSVNKLIRTSYDFVVNTAEESKLERLADECFPGGQAKVYLEVCRKAVEKVCPV